jgi:cell division protein FtsL
MVRVLNFFCVALMGLSILGLYHVSEKTRVTQVELARVERQIAQERTHLSVLETEWQHVAAPERIQRLAVARLGMADNASVQLSSFEMLPRRGAADPAPLNNAPIRNASVQIPVQSAAHSPAMSVAVPARPAPASISDLITDSGM